MSERITRIRSESEKAEAGAKKLEAAEGRDGDGPEGQVRAPARRQGGASEELRRDAQGIRRQGQGRSGEQGGRARRVAPEGDGGPEDKERGAAEGEQDARAEQGGPGRGAQAQGGGDKGIEARRSPRTPPGSRTSRSRRRRSTRRSGTAARPTRTRSTGSTG